MKLLNKSLAGHALTAMMLLASLAVSVKSSAGAPLAIATTTPLTPGVVGTPYANILIASGGTSPYTWLVLSGTLPDGLTLNPSLGTITGKPTTSGTATFFVQVTDNVGTHAFATFTLTIQAAISPLTISTQPTLPNGMINSTYTQTLAATGGVPPYVWTLASGSLPTGVSLSSNGVISGIPTATGLSTFTVLVTDAFNTAVSQQFNVTITPPSAMRSGVISQVASGGGWKTSIYLINNSVTAVPVTVQFWSNNGVALQLPVTLTQTSGVTVSTGSTVSGTIAPNDTLLIDSDTGASLETTGWADISSIGNLTGYGVFHYTSPQGVQSEGTIPLESAFTSTFILPYDSISSSATGVALTNLTLGNAASVIATVWGNGAKQLASQRISVPAGGHTAFLLGTSFPITAGNRGIIEFSAPSSVQITGLGLRVDGSGGITSLPVLHRP